MSKTAEKVQHTPAPWQLKIDNSSVVVDIGSDDPPADQVRWRLYRGEDAEMDAVTIANARLVSAAPDMYAAIKEFLAWQPMTGSDRDMFVRKFVAAMYKAEG